MKIVPLFGAGIESKSRTVTAQKRLNCYYEPRPDGDKSNVCIYGTPGLRLFIDLAVGSGVGIRGIYPPMGADIYLLVVCGNTLYQVDNAGSIAHSYSTLASFTGNVSITDNGQEYLIVDGQNGYVFEPSFSVSAGTLTQISDVNFPNGATTCTFLAGRFVVEEPDSGRLWVSDSYDGTSWPALGFATAEQNTDSLVAIDTNNGHLIPFGRKSLEFWGPVPTTPVPYAPMTGATQQWGLAARWSRAKVNGNIIFLASNNQGECQFMELRGYQAVPISTPDINKIINGFGDIADAEAFGYVVNGHGMYEVTFPSSNRTLLYDASTGFWQDMQTGATANRRITKLSTQFNGKSVVGDYNSSKLYYIDDDVYTDNGAVIRREIQTRHVESDGNEFSIGELWLDMETGVGISTGQGSDPQIMLKISKDGGRTFGPEIWADIGPMGEYGTRVVWRRLGSFRDAVFNFAMTDPVPWAITKGGMSISVRPQ